MRRPHLYLVLAVYGSLASAGAATWALGRHIELALYGRVLLVDPRAEQCTGVALVVASLHALRLMFVAVHVSQRIATVRAVVFMVAHLVGCLVLGCLVVHVRITVPIACLTVLAYAVGLSIVVGLAQRPRRWKGED